MLKDEFNGDYRKNDNGELEVNGCVVKFYKMITTGRQVDMRTLSQYIGSPTTLQWVAYHTPLSFFHAPIY